MSADKSRQINSDAGLPVDERDFAPQIMLCYDICRAAGEAQFADIIATQAFSAAVLYDSGDKADEAAFQKAADPLVKQLQAAGIAVMIAGSSAVFGRLKADGLHIEENADAKEQLKDMRGKYGDKRLLGYGNPHNRHQALEAGECGLDYIFFGKLGMDKKPEPHPRNISLGAWWAEIMQPDCVIQAGSDLSNLAELRDLRADFIALEEAIFSAADPRRALMQAQEILTEKAA